MVKDTTAKLHQVSDWFRGVSTVTEAFYVLIEVVGFKYLAQQSDAGKVLWNKYLQRIPPGEETNREVELLFSEQNWHANFLLPVLRSSGDIEFINRLFRFAEDIGQDNGGHETAYAFIELSNKNKSKGSFFFPLEIDRLLTMLSPVTPIAINPVSVLCSGAGTLGVAIELRKQGAQIRFEIQQSSYHADILFKITGGSGECMYTDTSESLASRDRKHFSFGAVIPPWDKRISHDLQRKWSYTHYAVRPTSAESFYIQDTIERVDGRVAIILPPAFLFRTAGSDLDLKMYLAEEGLIEAVIQLPKKLLSFTSVAPALLVLNTFERHEDVMFIDASSNGYVNPDKNRTNVLQDLEKIVALVDSRRETEDSRKVGLPELADNKFNLSVKRYVVSDEERQLQDTLAGEETWPLENIVEIIRAQSIKDGEIRVMVREANPGDILETGYIESPAKIVAAGEEKFSRYKRQQLLPGDILMTIKGAIGRTAIVPPDAGEDWYAGQSFVILRLRPDSPISDPIILYRYLASDLAQQLLSSRSAGATVRLIKMQDLRMLPVIIPTVEEQQAILENNRQIVGLYQDIESTIHQIKVLKAEFWGLDSDNG